MILPGAELAEGLEGCGGHIAQSSIVAQQQESQHLEPQQHKRKLKIEYATEHISAGLEKPGRDVPALNTASQILLGDDRCWHSLLKNKIILTDSGWFLTLTTE